MAVGSRLATYGGLLLLELLCPNERAKSWCKSDHHDDPVNDVKRTHELLYCGEPAFHPSARNADEYEDDAQCDPDVTEYLQYGDPYLHGAPFRDT